MRGIGILAGTSHTVCNMERFVILQFVITRAGCIMLLKLQYVYSYYIIFER